MKDLELKIGVKPLPHAAGLSILSRGTAGAAGYDLAAAIEESLNLVPGARLLVACGFTLEMPSWLEAQIRPRSGLALHHGVTVLNSPGTIDSDYRGEIKVILIHHGEQDFIINRGDRIAQLVFSRVEHPDFASLGADISDTARGEQGFGSTGMALDRSVR